MCNHVSLVFTSDDLPGNNIMRLRQSPWCNLLYWCVCYCRKNTPADFAPFSDPPLEYQRPKYCTDFFCHRVRLFISISHWLLFSVALLSICTIGVSEVCPVHVLVLLSRVETTRYPRLSAYTLAPEFTPYISQNAICIDQSSTLCNCLCNTDGQC